MGAHALDEAAYSAKAAGLTAPDRPTAIGDEIHWQIAHMSAWVRSAPIQLPRLAKDPAGHMGPAAP